MKIAIAALCAALPFGALAGPIVTQSSDSATSDFILDVEFWGTVQQETYYSGSGPSTIGDPVHGHMYVRSALASPDLDNTSNNGTYGYNFNGYGPRVPAPSGFVTSDLQTFVGTESEDNVFVHDYPFLGGEGLRVSNREFGPDGYSTLSISDLTTRDIIQGDSLFQRFDDSPAGVGGIAGGDLWTAMNGVVHEVGFTLDRMRATPKVCRS